MSIGSTLKKLRAQKNLNKKEAARFLGMPYTTYNNYESDTREPGSKALIKLSRFYEVSIDYLLENPYTPEISFLEDEYRSLDTYGQKAVEAVLGVECERCNQADNTTKIKEDNFIYISYNALPVSAGAGANLGAGELEQIKVPDTPIARKAHFALTVRGDSMEPEYRDGDIVLIRTEPVIHEGEIGVFILNDEGYIKRWSRDGLESLNDSYATIKIKEYDSFYTVGKVLGKTDIL